MASVPQQMQQNMVFAAAPQMTTPQGQLLLTTGQTMGQPINGPIGQYIQTGYPTTGFVTQGPNQYMMNPYPVMMNAPFQTANSVQNLAIQIPQNNGQQLIATTPTQMMQQAPQQHHQQQQQNTGGKGNQKGQQMGGQQQMMKGQVTANKSLHPGQQMASGPQNGQQQPQLIQQSAGYFVAPNGQTFQAVAAQPQAQPQQMQQQQQQQPQQQQQQGNKKGNVSILS